MREHTEQRDAVQYARLEAHFPEGESLSLGADNLRSFVISDASSQTGGISVGFAAMRELKTELEGDFAAYDWDNASVDAYVIDGETSMRYGRYTVATVKISDGTTVLQMYDPMYLHEQEYASELTFPASVAAVLTELAEVHGYQVPGLTQMDFNDIMIAAKPAGITERQMIAYLMQLAGGYVARFNASGQLVFAVYDKTAWQGEPYEISGLITEDYEPPVTVTGIRCVVDNVEYMEGDSGYVIELTGNPLIHQENAAEAVQRVAAHYVGLTTCPCSISVYDDYALECVDAVRVRDRSGAAHDMYIMSLSTSLQDVTACICTALPKAKQAASGGSAGQRILQAAEKSAEQKLNQYDATVKSLTETISHGLGLFITREKQPDGSVITYLHDNADMEQSLVRFYATANGLIGQTRPNTEESWTTTAALSAMGQALLQVLTVQGLNAGWINSGTFAARDPDGNIVFSVNVETGEVLINAASITMTSGKTVQQEVDALQGQVDGLQIGGRNLWLNSTFDAELDGYTNNHQYGGQIEVISDGYTGHKALRLDRSAYTGSNRCYLMSNKPPAVQEYKAGDTFTLSAWVYIEQTLTQAHNQRESAIMVRGTSGDKPQITIPNTTPVGQWTFLSEVHTFGADGSFVNTFVMLGGNGTMLVSCIKLEQGNIATDWTPAPEDTDARVSVVEATVEQQAEEIAEKVSKDKIVAAINMSEEEIQILAAKLKLEGLITANGGFMILEDGSPEITAGHIKILGSSEDDSIISLLYKYKNEVWESTISPRTSTFARYYIPNPETEEVTASSQIHVRGDLIRLENWDETAGELADSTDITPEEIATSGKMTAMKMTATELVCDTLTINGTQETFALANSTKTFAFSETDYPPGRVAELTITGNAGVAYALILFSSTMTLAVNSSTWTGNGSIKLTQTNSREITFTYTGTGAATFTSKIIVK